MEGKMCAAFVIVVLSSVLANYNENLACCHRSMITLIPPQDSDKWEDIPFYIIQNETKCYDPEKNFTSPLKLACDGGYITFPNFTVDSGFINIQVSDELEFSLNSDIACYGNLTTDRNVTKSGIFPLICITDEDIYIDEEGVFEKCALVSVVCLILTIIIYAMFAELRDLFGKSVISFCGSLAMGMGLMSSMSFGALETNENVVSCAMRGFSAYFFMMAAFFWSNSLSIQVLRDTRRPSTEDYSWREFKWYAFYSWGFPTVLTTIMAIVNYHPGNHQKPGLGLNHCFFISERQQWYYMHSVISVILVINFAIFIYIATTLWRFAFKSTHMKSLKYKILMTLRLIVLMGLPWVIEMVRSAARARTFGWFVLDLVTALHGLLIFLVLVLRKRVVRLVFQRGWLVWCSGPAERWLARGDDELKPADDDVSLHEEQTDQAIY